MSPEAPSDPQRWLRRSLRANAAFSALSGLLFAGASETVAGAIGLAWPNALAATGLVLVGFAAVLAWLASRPAVPVRDAMVVIWMDLAWVVGTLPLVATGVLDATGGVAALLVADVVLAFAVLQYVGVRRSRRAAAAGPG